MSELNSLLREIKKMKRTLEGMIEDLDDLREKTEAAIEASQKKPEPKNDDDN